MWLRLVVCASVVVLLVAIASAEEYSPLFSARLEATLAGWDDPGQPVDAGGGSEDPMVVSILPPGSLCLASGCVGSACLGSLCLGSGCGGSICVGSGCANSTCLGSGCVGSVCVVSGCVAETLCEKKCGGEGPPNAIDPDFSGTVSVFPQCPEM